MTHQACAGDDDERKRCRQNQDKREACDADPSPASGQQLGISHPQAIEAAGPTIERIHTPEGSISRNNSDTKRPNRVRAQSRCAETGRPNCQVQKVGNPPVANVNDTNTKKERRKEGRADGCDEHASPIAGAANSE